MRMHSKSCLCLCFIILSMCPNFFDNSSQSSISHQALTPKGAEKKEYFYNISGTLPHLHSHYYEIDPSANALEFNVPYPINFLLVNDSNSLSTKTQSFNFQFSFMYLKDFSTLFYYEEGNININGKTGEDYIYDVFILKGYQNYLIYQEIGNFEEYEAKKNPYVFHEIHTSGIAQMEYEIETEDFYYVKIEPRNRTEYYVHFQDFMKIQASGKGFETANSEALIKDKYHQFISFEHSTYEGILIINPVDSWGDYEVRVFTPDENPLTDSYRVGKKSLDIRLSRYFNVDALDPQDPWINTGKTDIYINIAETLFLYTSTQTLIPYLAEDFGMWNEDLTQYTVPLRQQVKFHDNSDFTAESVQWNFERIQNLLDSKQENYSTFLHPLHSCYPKLNTIINHTEVIDSNTIKFHLNYPYIDFPKILSHGNTLILSSMNLPKDKPINFSTDRMVGTGPYRSRDLYTIIGGPNDLIRNEEYWNGTPSIHSLQFDNINSVSNSFLSSILSHTWDVINPLYNDYVDSMAPSREFNLSPKITPMYQSYLGMNTLWLPIELREIFCHLVYRSKMFSGMYSQKNPSYATEYINPEYLSQQNQPKNLFLFNLTLARTMIIDLYQNSEYNDFWDEMKNGPLNWKKPSVIIPDVTDDEAWMSLVTDGTPLFKLNISYFSNNYYGWMGRVFSETLNLVGIELEEIGFAWKEYVNSYNNLTQFSCFFFSSAQPHINDIPSFVSQFLPGNYYNWCQVNQSSLTEEILEYYQEPDLAQRLQLEANIICMINEILPYVPYFHSSGHALLDAHIQDYILNSEGQILFGSAFWADIDVYADLNDYDEFGIKKIHGFHVFFISFSGLIGISFIVIKTFKKSKRPIVEI